MPEITIQYNNRKTLLLLRDLSKYFDFAIKGMTSNDGKEELINEVTFIPPDESIDISELKKIFKSKGLDAAKIRNEAWQRGN